MGGDVYHWNEETDINWNGGRGLRSGAWADYSGSMASSCRYYYSPANEFTDVGFRVAMVPEPGSIVLLLVGAISFVTYAWRRPRLAAF